MYLQSKGQRDRSRGGGYDHGESGMPILVMKDEETMRAVAPVVPEKGSHPHAINVLRHEVDLMGHTVSPAKWPGACRAAFKGISKSV